MDQYLTTYKKDYPWPATRIKRKPTELDEYGACKCRDIPREIKPLTHCGDDYDWSRTGPMGRLLDPKLFPAKTGPQPETDITKFDQPDVFMRKLEEKYPNLYGILQTTPIDEVIRRVDQDRLKTTYQLDYSERAARMMEEAAVGPCKVPKEEEKDIDCRPYTRRPKIKVKNEVEKKKKKPKKAIEDEQETRLPPWRSEYQETINRLGQMIMKHKIHGKSSVGPTWAMAVL
ncbi:uncharacterized protein LOC102677448 isoform X1 [Apis dorsata]|uniref:uncharacterized protein LOC102677448 isoform X1 n=1 Tax=Apis dorsata TaxID=7462 RepID=UPI0003DF61D5|nr:uncharacterized protein LOC102677448 isoform X1 [Apis dorsata]